MIYKNDGTLPKEYLEQLTGQGSEGLADRIFSLVNHPIRIERENYPAAKLYERSKDRRGPC